MNILVRVDAYAEIALGHLSRCIELGKALSKLNNKVVFLTYEDCASKPKLDEFGLDYKLIPYKINDVEDIDAEIKALEKFSDSIDVLIVDSYNVDNQYFYKLDKLFSKIVYLDDMGFDFNNVDMVVNPSCKVKKNDYISKDVLCGMEFIILGEDYRTGLIKESSERVKSILITMGGIDHYNLSSRLLPIIEKIDKDIVVNMIIGPYYENFKQIKIAAKNSKLSINFYEGLSNISSVMMQSDVAVSAGGFTIYELAAMSIPSVGIALWDNQKVNIECLSNKEAIIPLYYFRGEEFDTQLHYNLKKLIASKKIREKISLSARRSISGNGVDKIAKVISRKYG